MTVTLDGIFNEGTVSVSTGSTTLTFTGTFLLGGCVPFDSVEFAGASVRPKAIVSDTEATLAVPWGGANVVNQPFAWFFNAPSRLNGADTRQTIQDFALYAKRGGFRPGRTVTAAADPIDISDLERTITYNRGTAIAVSLAKANTNNLFVDGWRVYVKNKGAGTVTITPTGCTINGAASLALLSGTGAIIFSQGGNYEVYILTSADMRKSDNLAGLTDKSLACTNLGAVQQGGGAGQLSNKVYIGWSADGLKAQVDSTDQGRVWTDGFAPANNNAYYGYQKLPSGVMLQWATSVFLPDSNGQAIISFPIAFSTASAYYVKSFILSSAGVVVFSIDEGYSSATSFRVNAFSSVSGAPITSGGYRINYIAVGN